MSFKTSPVLNRLKNIKGWKQSSFPRKTSDYSRDIVLGLKIYLLLQAYLSINNFKLVAFQTRIFEKSEKILYLVIAQANSKPKKKRIDPAKQFLNFPQPLFLLKNKKIIYLLYKNVFILKRLISYHKNFTQKKIPSKLWWKRTQLKSWIQFMHYLQRNRIQKNNSYVRYSNWRNYQHFRLKFPLLKKISLTNKNFLNSHLKKKLFFKLHGLEKECFLLQKNVMILKLYLSKMYSDKNRFNLYLNLILFFKKKLRIKYFHLQQVRKACLALRSFYIFFYKKTRIFEKHKITQKQIITYYLEQKQNRNLSHWKNLRKQLGYVSFLYGHGPNLKNTLWIKHKSNSFPKTHPYGLEILLSKKYFSFMLKLYLNLIKMLKVMKQKAKDKIFVQSQIYKRYSVISKNYITFLNQNEGYFKDLCYVFRQPLYIKRFKLHLFSYKTKIKNKKKKKKSITYIFQNLKIHYSLRKFFQKKKRGQFFQLKSYSWIPSVLSLLKLLRWKKQQDQSNLRYRIEKKLFQPKIIFNSLENKNKKKIIQSSRRKNNDWKKIPINVTGRKLLKNYSKNTYGKNLVWKRIKQKDINMWRDSFQYRIPYRVEEACSSLLITKHRLKYIIQNFLQRYLQINFTIKIINSTNEFKNLKFYRLFFPNSSWKNFPEITLKKNKTYGSLWLYPKKSRSYFPNKNLRSNHARYIYLGVRAMRFLNKNQAQKKVIKIQKHFNFHLLSRYQVSSNRGKSTSLNKKNLSKNKILKNIYWYNYQRLKMQSWNTIYKNYTNSLGYNSVLINEKYTSWQYRNLTQERKIKNFVKRSVPILSVFIKYLDPQILANHIARELEYTKYHWSILYALRNILSLIPFQRLIAYRIGIFGRINSSKKARLLYFKKGKLPLQNLTKNINFAMSQGRARIGSFGVKVWVYF